LRTQADIALDPESTGTHPSWLGNFLLWHGDEAEIAANAYTTTAAVRVKMRIGNRAAFAPDELDFAVKQRNLGLCSADEIKQNLSSLLVSWR